MYRINHLMCQTLCYIPETFCGQPVFGWGWGLGLFCLFACLSQAWQYYQTKKIKTADIGSAALLLLFGGIILIYVIPATAEHGHGIPIRGYGLCLLFAIFLGCSLVVYLAAKKGIAGETAASLCFWTCLTGVIGARIFYVTEYWRDMLCFDAAGQFRPVESFFNVLNIAQGGLVVFGSILGGMLGGFIYMQVKKLPVLKSFDAVAVGLMLGIAIGRIGCLCNGCCYGGITDVPWGITFPEGSPVHLHQIAHGDIFCCGLKFKEVPAGNTSGHTVLAVAEVAKGSTAEKIGMKKGMKIRSIGNKDVVLNVRTCHDAARLLSYRQETVACVCQGTGHDAARLLSYRQEELSDKRIRFDIFSNAARTETVPYFLERESSPVLPVHPTQIYSSVSAFCICGLLLLLGRLDFYKRHDGLVFATFMLLYPAVRFMLEMIRTDEESFFGTGLTVSQNVSVAVFIAGAVLFAVAVRKNGKRTVDYLRK